MWGRRLTVATGVAVLGAFAPAATAHACSCAPVGPQEALRESDAAIVGRLVKVVPRSAIDADYRYEVQRVYRGARMIDRGQMLSVRSARRAAACALPHHTGRRYGLFLLREEGRWHSGLCAVVSPRRLREAAQGSRIYHRAGGAPAFNCA